MLFWLGVIFFVIVAIYAFSMSVDPYIRSRNLILGFVYLVGGPLGYWTLSMLIYRFGELIEAAKDARKDK